MKRLLVCGDRNWQNYWMVKSSILALHESLGGIAVVIEGECRGADLLSKRAAKEIGIPVLPFVADWAKYGRAAGPIRNKRMLDEGLPDVGLAFHASLSLSRGTKNMVELLAKAGKEVWLCDGMELVMYCQERTK